VHILGRVYSVCTYSVQWNVQAQSFKLAIQVDQAIFQPPILTHLLTLFLYPPPHMHAALCIAHWPHSKTKLWRERTTSSGAKGWQRSYQPVLRALRRAPTLLSWCVNSSVSFLCLPGASCRLLVHLRLAPHSHHPLPTPLFFFCCGREGKDRER